MLVDPAGKLNQADLAISQGNWDLGERLCRDVLAVDGDQPLAILLLGVAQFKKGSPESALPLLHKASQLSPNGDQPHLWLSRTFRRLRRLDDAIYEAEAAAKLNENDPAVLHQLGLAYLDGKRYPLAVGALKRATEINPKSPQLLVAYGQALLLVGKRKEAVEALKGAQQSAESNPRVLPTIRQAFIEAGEGRTALEISRVLVRLAPRNPDFHLFLAKDLLEANQAPLAAESLAQASKLGGPNPNTAELKGAILQGLGRFKEADQEFLLSISARPIQGSAYLAWAQNRRVGDEDRQIVEQMQKVAGDRRLPADQAASLHFALGKSLEDLGEFQPSMDSYRQANELGLQTRFGAPFSRDLYAKQIDSLIQNLGQSLAPQEPSETTPIFVIGMIRSGTTLVDQILSSHPEIGSVGENAFWLERLPALIEDLSGLAKARDEYLEILRSTGKQFVVEKMPDNYLLAPLLHAAFPNARFLHIRRNPEDNTFSIYATPNRTKGEWAYDLQDIAFVYRKYDGLMKTWRPLIPALDVRYEDLVSETERVAREMLEFAGIPWDEACLRPEENRRTVTTPSVWQARQPVYSSSIGRAARFAEWIKQGDPDEAARLTQAGFALVERGDFPSSIEPLERVLTLDPASKEVPPVLSLALQRVGRLEEALALALQGVLRAPESPVAQDQLSRCYMEHGRYEEALTHSVKATATAPDAAWAHLGLGQALQGLYRYEEAKIAFRRAIKLEPSSIPALRSLTEILIQLSEPEDAVKLARKIADLQNDSAEAHLLLARCLLLQGRSEECLEQVESAKSFLGSAPVAYQIGILSQSLGRIDDAKSYFKKSIEMEPRQGAAYAFLSYVENEVDQNLLDQMRSLAEQASLPIYQQSLLNYALGKSTESLDQYEDAMRFFDEANRLTYQQKFGETRFDLHQFTIWNDKNIDGLSHLSARGDKMASNLPIFVIGMIRSGTTLVEQILSSHRKVGAAGEQSFWMDHASEAIQNPIAGKRLGQEYLSRLKRISPGAAHVVDKMPMNYALAPLVHHIFPNAKIIQVKRDPVDTMLSIYTTINPARIEWMHDKWNIACAYREYLRTMEHWRKLLPPESFLEIDYENLVQSPEEVSREMIEFCGLDWDEACVKPESNGRAVVTPSVWQVRQPIYKSSVKRWQRYEPWLGPLKLKD